MTRVDILKSTAAHPAVKTQPTRERSQTSQPDTKADSSFGKALADRRAAADKSRNSDEAHASAPNQSSHARPQEQPDAAASRAHNDKVGDRKDKPEQHTASGDKAAGDKTAGDKPGAAAVGRQGSAQAKGAVQASSHISRRRLDLRVPTGTDESKAATASSTPQGKSPSQAATTAQHVTAHPAHHTHDATQAAASQHDSARAGTVARNRNPDKSDKTDHKTHVHSYAKADSSDAATTPAAVTLANLANLAAPQQPATAVDRHPPHAADGDAPSRGRTSALHTTPGSRAALVAHASAAAAAGGGAQSSADATGAAVSSATFETLVSGTDTGRSGQKVATAKVDSTSSTTSSLLQTLTAGHTAAPTTAAAPAAPAAQAAPAALAAPLGSDAWNAALGQQSLRLVQNGNGHAELILHPRDLGQIQVSLKIGDQSQAQLHFVSPHAHVREAVEAALPQLRQAFAAGGLTLGQASVGDQSAQQQAFSHHGRDPDGSRRRPRTLGAIGDSPAPEPTRITTLIGRSAAGGIDIFA